MVAINSSPTLLAYRNKMIEVLSLIYPVLNLSFLSKVVEDDIQKNFRDAEAEIRNSYTRKTTESTLLAISDFIDKKKPCCTGMGTLFKQHDQSRNLMFETMQSFLDLRKIYKKKMFDYEKGTDGYKKYNLLQLLT